MVVVRWFVFVEFGYFKLFNELMQNGSPMQTAVLSQIYQQAGLKPYHLHVYIVGDVLHQIPRITFSSPYTVRVNKSRYRNI